MRVGDRVRLKANIHEALGDGFFAIGVTGYVVTPKRYPDNSPDYVYVRLDNPPPEGTDWSFLPQELEVIV